MRNLIWQGASFSVLSLLGRAEEEEKSMGVLLWMERPYPVIFDSL